MRFEGLVWRHVPRGAHPLDFSALIRAPSAAMEGEVTLAIYPENRPRELRIEVHSENVPLNYGEDPFVDGDGLPTRDAP